MTMTDPRDPAADNANHQQQRDADAQAQTVADEALQDAGDTGLEPSDKVRGGLDVSPDDTPDLIDRMEGMVASGHIDMDAFVGEPAHDDEDNMDGDEEDMVEDE
jgi:hypothetical protein